MNKRLIINNEEDMYYTKRILKSCFIELQVQFFLQQLYDIINMPIVEKSNFYNDTEEILKKQLNMQEGVKKLKLERR